MMFKAVLQDLRCAERGLRAPSVTSAFAQLPLARSVVKRSGELAGFTSPLAGHATDARRRLGTTSLRRGDAAVTAPPVSNLPPLSGVSQ